jgi:hypothetical protein
MVSRKKSFLPLDGGGLRRGWSPSPLSPPLKGGDGNIEECKIFGVRIYNTDI